MPKNINGRINTRKWVQKEARFGVFLIPNTSTLTSKNAEIIIEKHIADIILDSKPELKNFILERALPAL
jgi:hypothetical protein